MSNIYFMLRLLCVSSLMLPIGGSVLTVVMAIATLMASAVTGFLQRSAMSVPRSQAGSSSQTDSIAVMRLAIGPPGPVPPSSTFQMPKVLAKSIPSASKRVRHLKMTSLRPLW